MNEILQALKKANELGYAFGMGRTGYDQFTITLLECRTKEAHEQILPADHLDQLPQVIDFLIKKFEEPEAKFPESLITRPTPSHIGREVSNG